MTSEGTLLACSSCVACCRSALDTYGLNETKAHLLRVRGESVVPVWVEVAGPVGVVAVMGEPIHQPRPPPTGIGGYQGTSCADVYHAPVSCGLLPAGASTFSQSSTFLVAGAG